LKGGKKVKFFSCVFEREKKIIVIAFVLIAAFVFVANNTTVQSKTQDGNHLVAQQETTTSDNNRQKEGQTQSELTITFPMLVVLLILLALLGALAGVLFNVRSSVVTIQRDNLMLQARVFALEETIKNLKEALPEEQPKISSTTKTHSMNVAATQEENSDDTHILNREPFVLDQGAPGLNGLSLHNARAAYRALVAGNKVIPNPLYLKAEATSSLSDMFGKGEVFLGETEHGAFVLLRATELDKRGWVFPNPSLYYRGEALRPVFPNLKETDFTHRKQSIDPVAVTQVGKKRWVVGQNA
jgi:hypothetical protein